MRCRRSSRVSSTARLLQRRSQEMRDSSRFEKNKCTEMKIFWYSAFVVSFLVLCTPVGGILCPDRVTHCLNDFTCCQNKDDTYACCPMKDAVCCSDKKHCCPYGFLCNLDIGACVKSSAALAVAEPLNKKAKNTQLPFVLRVEGRKTPILSLEDKITCPGGRSYCPSKETCCKLPSSAYGCCPLPHAVCCSDHRHCCPTGFTCHAHKNTCTRGPLSLPAIRKTVVADTTSKHVLCPDKISYCPNQNTCCLLPNGMYGCCPLPSAVCCLDHIHCCPAGYQCDVAAGTCNKGISSVPALLRRPSTPRTKGESIMCPDGESECPDGETCCLLSSGTYGCCPFPSAVCCSDDLHCCPAGYQCDVAAGTCNKGISSVPALLRRPSIPKTKGESIMCPDGESECPDGETCCLLSSGTYGCCPFPSAVCCSDDLHCCPAGYQCDVAAGTCNKGISSVPALLRRPSIPKTKGENIICPGGQSECPDGNTCCLLSSGTYGCCPLPSAVCCSDHLHCCPAGYQCDVAAGTCNKGISSVPALLHRPSIPKTKGEKIICPGGQSECPDGNTCCLLSSGTYACCPLPSAVCCSDDLHCCPAGYQCDVAAGTCNKGISSVPALLRRPSIPKTKGESIMCPDGESECPDGETCCLLSSGTYGCCPFPSAVCCSDHLHCCPAGYQCDVAAGTCNKGISSVPALLRRPSIPKTKGESIMCPDRESECPDGETCCLLSSGTYGCCPFPSAVCCSDHLHCCPAGYQCDVAAGTCNKGISSVPALLRRPSIPKTKGESIMCPDGESECPDGETCCLLSSGTYGCCPFPSAVCCSDHLHCCPAGYQCDVAAGTCNKGISSVPALLRRPSIPKTKGESIMCPDGESECPDGETCCLLSSGTYGCCPFPSAVCCSDDLHCCPAGYQCDVAAGTCNKGISSVPALLRRPSIPKTKGESIMCPDGESECPDGETCCLLSSGTYGCCPFPSAVCCSDHLHCCPAGYQCDVAAGTCNKGISSVPALLRRPSIPKTKGESIMCPDGESECPDGETCCLLSSGTYGCCPFPSAVCCLDHIHCCPAGYQCDVAAGTCNKGSSSVPALLHRPSIPKTKGESIMCPDGQSECPDGETCCLLSSGTYGCCPFPSAVCCSDDLHCCPAGYQCDVAAGTCNKGISSVPALLRRPSIPKTKGESIMCPDGESECPDGETCCLLSSGTYGCCPFPSAVCCSDHLHCCPAGYQCDVAAGTCNKGISSVPALLRRPSIPKTKGESIMCPGGQSECPDGNTCCLLSSGTYACCPLPSAVCCSDDLHCCPAGYQCDVAAGTCNKGISSVPALLRRPSIPKTKGESIMCPDGQSECPDGETCCLLSSGMYGCCPLPSAVCCLDHIHCCPAGYQCDVAAGTCNKGSSSVPALLHRPSIPKTKGESIMCPDGQSECPDGETCCLLSSGTYGCCPFPSAVCCSDDLHCCPAGYQCNVAAGTCNKGISSVPALLRRPSIPKTKGESIMCPDGESECPDGETCCLLSSGTYGCCPFPSAVCCSDHLHCCPAGYQCDVAAGTCNKGISSVPALLRRPSIPKTKGESIMCPGGQSECPDGNTCCLLSSGTYACCPLPSAVCCSDDLHCCPAGYQCDVAAGTCNKGISSVPALLRRPSIPKTKGESIMCPDGQSECPDGNTCCLLSSGMYGCCPLPSAVCCLDHIHCCPAGYQCDVAAGTCNKGSSSVPALLHRPSIPKTKGESIMCPDGQSECPDGETCCLLSSGTYGCCPFPSAVCCSDDLHCCPAGYQCDVAAGTCNKGISSVPALLRRPSIPKTKGENIICPGGQSECPDGNTCCLLSSGTYACCPLPSAVCCSDDLHCCPAGYQCDVAAGTCNKGISSVPALLHRPSIPKTKGESIMCPDGQSECRDGETCCLLSSGTYGCCPFPSAVCCSDDLHCCPAGYQCDVAAGTCNKGISSVPALLRRPSIPKTKGESIMCPDGQSECPDGNTCCLLSSGMYGCCPLPSAVCCLDHIHCCPAGYQCDVAAGTCNKGISSVPALLRRPSTPRTKGESIMCPDGESECPDGETCCLLSSGTYGCCPFPSAVCCSDDLHCCPAGYQCDVAAGTCNKGISSVPALLHRPFKKRKGLASMDDLGGHGMGLILRYSPYIIFDSHVFTVFCPGKEQQCPDGFSCCLLPDKVYGCCPFANAVCCKDHIHCCPSGYNCNLEKKTCEKGPLKNLNAIVPAFTRRLFSNLRDKSNIVCPDQRSECPSFYTCCLLKSGDYGCCPMPNAVCCSDKEHCCPHGTLCDVKAGMCSDLLVHEREGGPLSNVLISMRRKVPALFRFKRRAGIIVCPDQRHACANDHTCCKDIKGGWSCCPLDKAVCCLDGIHCCMHGTTCDLEHKACIRKENLFPLFKRRAMNLQKPSALATSNLCPEDHVLCSSDETYRCCSSDQVCTTSGYCKPKLPPSLLPAINDILCPDQRSKCIVGTTCCKTSTGSYRCCPLPEAICCDDGVHCCPLNWICETDMGTCRKPKSSERVKATITSLALRDEGEKHQSSSQDYLRFTP